MHARKCVQRGGLAFTSCSATPFRTAASAALQCELVLLQQCIHERKHLLQQRVEHGTRILARRALGCLCCGPWRRRTVQRIAAHACRRRRPCRCRCGCCMLLLAGVAGGAGQACDCRRRRAQLRLHIQRQAQLRHAECCVLAHASSCVFAAVACLPIKRQLLQGGAASLRQLQRRLCRAAGAGARISARGLLPGRIGFPLRCLAAAGRRLRSTVPGGGSGCRQRALVRGLALAGCCTAPLAPLQLRAAGPA